MALILAQIHLNFTPPLLCVAKMNEKGAKNEKANLSRERGCKGRKEGKENGRSGSCEPVKRLRRTHTKSYNVWVCLQGEGVFYLGRKGTSEVEKTAGGLLDNGKQVNFKSERPAKYKQISVKKGDVIVYAKGEYHGMKNTGKEEFTRRLRGAGVIGAKSLISLPSASPNAPSERRQTSLNTPY